MEGGPRGVRIYRPARGPRCSLGRRRAVTVLRRCRNATCTGFTSPHLVDHSHHSRRVWSDLEGGPRGVRAPGCGGWEVLGGRAFSYGRGSPVKSLWRCLNVHATWTTLTTRTGSCQTWRAGPGGCAPPVAVAALSSRSPSLSHSELHLPRVGPLWRDKRSPLSRPLYHSHLTGLESLQGLQGLIREYRVS